MDHKIKNDLSKTYHEGVIAIHWITLALLIILFVSGKYMEDLKPYQKKEIVISHVIIGAIVFILTILRSWFYFKFERPEPIKTGSLRNDKLMVWIHKAFYFLLFSIVLTGVATAIFGSYFSFFDAISLTSYMKKNYFLEGHNVFSILTLLFLILHVLGVIKHYVSAKENTLKRIS